MKKIKKWELCCVRVKKINKEVLLREMKMKEMKVKQIEKQKVK